MRPSWMPSIGDIIFVLLLSLFFLKIPNFIFGDGSTGWHLVTGQFVLEHMQIPHTDLISYTFPDKPWVAYEWLFDTVIAGLDKLAGLRLVAVACCSVIAWLFLMIYDDCRKQGCHFVPAMFLSITAALISAVHWLARPVLVTFYGVYFYCRFLQEFCEDKISAKKLMLLLGLVMLVWVNSHPAFLMGIAITSIYFIADLIVYTCTAASEMRKKCLSRLKSLGALLILISATTLLNPYGLELHRYIFEYLHQSVVLSQNDEFASPEFHGQLQSVLLELLYFILAIGLVCTSKKPSLSRLLTVLAYVHLSLSSKRNMPLFVIVAVPFIAQLIANSRFSYLLSAPDNAPAQWLSKVKQRWVSLGETMDSMEFSCTRHALPLVAIVILAVSCFNNGKALGTQLVSSDFDPKNKPSTTLDYLKKNALDPQKGFTFDNWGGFIRYKTGMRVFIDDRSDFYGQKHYLDYADASTAQPNWREALSRHHIDWVLFPNNSLLAANLKLEKDWKLVCEDPASCLFVRVNPSATAQ